MAEAKAQMVMEAARRFKILGLGIATSIGGGLLLLFLGWTWSSGLSWLAVCVAVAWALGAIPWLLLAMATGIDTVVFTLTGGIALMPAIDSLAARWIGQQALAGRKRPPRKGTLHALSEFAFWTNPFSALLVATAFYVGTRRVHPKAVEEFIEGMDRRAGVYRMVAGSGTGWRSHVPI